MSVSWFRWVTRSIPPVLSRVWKHINKKWDRYGDLFKTWVQDGYEFCTNSPQFALDVNLPIYYLNK